MRVLFIENHDSFSWNVVDRLPVPRAAVRLVSGRAFSAGDLDEADVLVIGPGPLDPVRAGLVGLVSEAAARRLPTLGVCLGHQAIGLAFGATLMRTTPMHGKRDVAIFGESRHFRAFVGPVEVMRYHSLAIDEVCSPLNVIARTRDGAVMAIEHESLPMAGVQFHPDSFATPRGEELFASFFEAVAS